MVMEKVLGSSNIAILVPLLSLALSVTKFLVIFKYSQSGSAVLRSLACLFCLFLLYQAFSCHHDIYLIVLNDENLLDHRRTRSRVFYLEAKQSSNSPPEVNHHLHQTGTHGQDDIIDLSNPEEDHQYSNSTTAIELNADCLEEIARRSTHFQDFVAFSEVSSLWRNISSNIEWDEFGPKPPCLMLSDEPGSDARPFFSLFNNRVFVLELEAAAGRRFSGSPHGWLAIVDDESLQPHLVNPISQVRVDLPPFPAIHIQLARGNLLNKVPKIFVFKIKIHPVKLLVMAILQSEDQLVFTTTPGDVGEWALVSNPDEFLFRSVAYFKHRVFTLCDNGSLVKIDFDGSIAARAEFVASHPMREYIGYQLLHEKTGRAYLVPSQEDLFGVFRYSSKDIGFDRTVEFSVYKFDFQSLEWEPVWSIGDKAFFVGSGNSWSISLAHTVNCNGDSIFYGDETEGGLGLDNGIYSLETWQTESLRFGADVPRSQPHTTWITPSLTPSAFR